MTATRPSRIILKPLAPKGPSTHETLPAGRTAYLAGFHAAQALLFETTGKVVRTHKGVAGEFGWLVKNDPRVDLELRAFLGRTYDLKTIADYESGPGAKVSAAQAAEAIAAALRRALGGAIRRG